MKLYRENRLDQEFQMEPRAIAKAYLDSEFSETGGLDRRALATFMTHPDGLNASWDDDDGFREALSQVAELRMVGDLS